MVKGLKEHGVSVQFAEMFIAIFVSLQVIGASV
jgi:hypothetical protein